MMGPTGAFVQHPYPFGYGLASVMMPSWGNDVSVDMVVANNVHHGSHQPGSKLLIRGVYRVF